MTIDCSKSMFVALLWMLPLCIYAGGGKSESSEKTHKKETEFLVSKIKNDDIKWIRTEFSIIPSVKGEFARSIIVRRNIMNIPLLLKALNDNDKFIVAHVILSRMLLSTIIRSDKTWNHLNVENAVENPEDEKKKIIKFWSELPLSKINPPKKHIL